MRKSIKIVGARTHNLKGIDCRFPNRRLSVVTGVSGSGKSSLVFDTLYAEGQRRYVQSLSTYARLFLEQMQRPDVDSISDIPPAIALEQKNAIKNARSTVGTITEVHDYLRLLVAHAGVLFCLDCKTPVEQHTVETSASAIEGLLAGKRILVRAPLLLHGTSHEEALAMLARQGYGRVFRDGAAVPLDDASSAPANEDRLDVVVDRLAVREERRGRLREALERAFVLGNGSVTVSDVDEGAEYRFTDRFACDGCGREYPKPTPQLLSFNSPLGACPRCEGFGRIVDIDLDKVVPNKRLSLRDGAVAPWSTPAYADFQRDFLRAAERLGHSTELPYSQLPEETRRWILEGDRENPGINGFFEWLESRRYKTHVRILLARYRTYRRCPSCHGARLRAEALAVRIGRRNIADFAGLSIGKLRGAVARLGLTPELRDRTASIMRELRHRLAYLEEVGLGYLTLDRQARTLSGGEAQRIHLASALGSALTETLYALDEPTVGLHPRDSARLLSVLRKLTKSGNTVVLVEHDPTLICGADHVIDLGPGGGTRGGEVIFQGPPAKLPSNNSATGRLLLIRTLHRQEKRPQRKSDAFLVIRGATEHNLDIPRLEIPLGRMVCITGVSGSGKSTLVENLIHAHFLRERGLAGAEAGVCEGVDGFEQLEDVLMMTQSPIGRSLRSNPVTYIKCYDDIRKLFAATPAARRAKVSATAFSFNSVGGRCERCQGTGRVTIEMHFMADIDVPCDDCGGKRFKDKILELQYQGRNINDVLKMTVEEGQAFFADRPAIKSRLDCLAAVGLGYLNLGQATSTLSGGEAQRLKLASFLVEERRSRGLLFIFDEPTTGLHLQDVHTLIGVLDGLVDRGHSVFVVEHHTDFISHADHIIDLGPEGGDGGGRVVVAGTPLEVAECAESHTGRELRQLLGLDEPDEASEPAV